MDEQRSILARITDEEKEGMLTKRDAPLSKTEPTTTIHAKTPIAIGQLVHGIGLYKKFRRTLI